MNASYLLAAALTLAAILAFLWRRTDSSLAKIYPYQNRGVLFSSAERSCFMAIEEALGKEYRILGKVELRELLAVRKDLTRVGRRHAAKRVDGTVLTFVICRRSDLSVEAAVELDDARDPRQGAGFLDFALAVAGIPLLHLPAKESYAPGEVRALLEKELVLNAPADAPEANAPPGEGLEIPGIFPFRTRQPQGMDAEGTPVCKKCGAEMVRLRAVKGPHAGQAFWACSGFPKCRFLMRPPVSDAQNDREPRLPRPLSPPGSTGRDAGQMGRFLVNPWDRPGGRVSPDAVRPEVTGKQPENARGMKK